MSSQTKTFLTPEESLALERGAETKSEYLAGESFRVPLASINCVLALRDVYAKIV